MLATVSLGAVWSSASPDFGVRGVLDRFGQIEPKVLFTADGYRYAGKRIELAGKLAELQPFLPERHALRRRRPPRRRARGRRGAVERRHLGGLHRTAPGDRAALRAAAVRSSARDPLLLRHHRRAEMHRASRRRAPAAPQGARPARRRPPGRPAVLLHHARLDDVELARLRPRARRDAPALRRLAVPSRAGSALRLRGGRADDPLRDLAQSTSTPCASPACARATATTSSSLRAVFSTGSPLAPEVLRLRLRRDQARPAPRLDLRAAPTSCPASCSATRLGRSTAARSRARASASPSRCATPTARPAAAGDQGRARLRRAVPGDAARLLERRGRRPLPRRLLRALSRRLVPGRLRRGHAARRLRHPRPLRRDAEPRRRAHRHRRDLRRGREDARGARGGRRSARTGTATCGSCSSSRCAPGRRSTTRSLQRIKAGIRAGSSPRHVPARIVAVADIPRTRTGKVSELAVRDVVHGRPVAEPRGARQPRGARALPRSSRAPRLTAGGRRAARAPVSPTAGSAAAPREACRGSPRPGSSLEAANGRSSP